MTREQNFRTTCISQLAAYSGWQNIPRAEIQKLPTANFPAFGLALGKTKYIAFDPSGKAISGEQDFSVTVYYLLPLRSIETANLDHSDITNIIEQFLNNPIYIPPAILPGETYRIERTIITEAKAPVIGSEDTRFSVTITAKYIFTIF